VGGKGSEILYGAVQPEHCVRAGGDLGDADDVSEIVDCEGPARVATGQPRQRPNSVSASPDDGPYAGWPARVADSCSLVVDGKGDTAAVARQRAKIDHAGDAAGTERSGSSPAVCRAYNFAQIVDAVGDLVITTRQPFNALQGASIPEKCPMAAADPSASDDFAGIVHASYDLGRPFRQARDLPGDKSNLGPRR
jgi:hypothetical protein